MSQVDVVKADVAFVVVENYLICESTGTYLPIYLDNT